MKIDGTILAESLACTGFAEHYSHRQPCLCYLYNRYDLAPRQWLSRHTLAPPVIPGPQISDPPHHETST